MAVFTTLDENEIAAFIKRFGIGELVSFQGISEGMENSNYLIATSASHPGDELSSTAQGDYVLTLLEELPASHLAFHVKLLETLARHHLPVASPLRDYDGNAVGELHGKPVLLSPLLPGRHALQPDQQHCVAVGGLLADMHLAAADMPDEHSGIRGAAWLKQCVYDASAYLDTADKQWVQEVYAAYQALDHDRLPTGIIHGDLFRDNVFFADHRLTGVIDFYNAGLGHLLFDVAVAVNDWCRDEQDGIDDKRYRALLQAYARKRPFTDSEKTAWPVMLKLCALRFWLSRILTNAGSGQGHELFVEKNPLQFRRLLAWHSEHSLSLQDFK